MLLYGCWEFDGGWNNFQEDFYLGKYESRIDIWLLCDDEVIWRCETLRLSRLSVISAINEFDSLDVVTTMMKDKSLFLIWKSKKVIKDSLCNQLQWPSTFLPWCVQYSENTWRLTNDVCARTLFPKTLPRKIIYSKQSILLKLVIW